MDNHPSSDQMQNAILCVMNLSWDVMVETIQCVIMLGPCMSGKSCCDSGRGQQHVMLSGAGTQHVGGGLSQDVCDQRST